MHEHDPHGDITRIFTKLFPSHGMVVREGQIALSHQFLDALLDKDIALCDAGTGTGKTYAYLIASVVFQVFSQAAGLPFQPMIISTSSITLQRAILADYVPFVSDVLLDDGFIQSPLRAVIRKGKSHYICDDRLLWRVRETEYGKDKTASRKLAKLLNCLNVQETDELKPYEQRLLCVPAVCECERKRCRYRDFVEESNREAYTFQICNHNLLLADAVHRDTGRRPILPDGCAIIIDEAHKITDAARQSLSDTLEKKDFQDSIQLLREGGNRAEADSLLKMARAFIKKAENPPDTIPIEDFIRLLIGPQRFLNSLLRKCRYTMNHTTRGQLERLSAAVDIFCAKLPGRIYFSDQNERGETILYASPPDLSNDLDRLLWQRSKPFLLTSGTLAVNGSFQRKREEMGLLHNRRVYEYSFPSPFAYDQNCLLYLPRNAPRVVKKATTCYYKQSAKMMSQLIYAACGHSLILFTNYEDMSGITELLKGENLKWPLLPMRRNDTRTLETFFSQPGSILLASGAAWEGMDFPGDAVSLLIIPRLPFPSPDALSEELKKNYKSTREYIRTVVVPQMQIKLRQGFGRAIRTETDTCVIAILDDRAIPGSAYYHAVLDALPEMRKTRNIHEVSRFIHNVKGYTYFLNPPRS